MAVGIIDLPFLDADTQSHTGLFVSSNDSDSGLLAPFMVLGAPGLDALANFGEGDIDANTLRTARATRRKNFVSLSSEVTTGGTAVAINPAGYVYIQITNPGSQTESLFINFTGAAATNADTADVELAPGASFIFSADGPVPIPTDNISINAATDGHSFLAIAA